MSPDLLTAFQQFEIAVANGDGSDLRRAARDETAGALVVLIELAERRAAQADEAFTFLERQVKLSRTGISFDWVASAEGDPSGYRFMRHHFLGDAKKTMLEAILAAARYERDGWPAKPAPVALKPQASMSLIREELALAFNRVLDEHGGRHLSSQVALLVEAASETLRAYTVPEPVEPTESPVEPNPVATLLEGVCEAAGRSEKAPSLDPAVAWDLARQFYSATRTSEQRHQLLAQYDAMCKAFQGLSPTQPGTVPPAAEVRHYSGGVRRDWVKCPVCGEPDMQRDIVDEEEHALITCTNHACASNGGDNCDALLERVGRGYQCKFWRCTSGHQNLFSRETCQQCGESFGARPAPRHGDALSLVGGHLPEIRKRRPCPACASNQTIGCSSTSEHLRGCEKCHAQWWEYPGKPQQLINRPTPPVNGRFRLEFCVQSSGRDTTLDTIDGYATARTCLQREAAAGRDVWLIWPDGTKELPDGRQITKEQQAAEKAPVIANPGVCTGARTIPGWKDGAQSNTVGAAIAAFQNTPPEARDLIRRLSNLLIDLRCPNCAVPVAVAVKLDT